MPSVVALSQALLVVCIRLHFRKVSACASGINAVKSLNCVFVGLLRKAWINYFCLFLPTCFLQARANKSGT